MPLFNEDDEIAHGPPEAALALRGVMREHDGLLLGVPEYNGGPPAALKNAIDWASRREEGEPPLVAFAGKAVALMSASPGGLGGLRGLVHARAILGNLGMLVLPKQKAVGGAFKAFDNDGSMADEKLQIEVTGLGSQLVDLLARLID